MADDPTAAIRETVDALAQLFGAQSFLADARRYGVIAGHPDTIALLRERWELPGVELVAHAWCEPGQLYTGELWQHEPCVRDAVLARMPRSTP